MSNPELVVALTAEGERTHERGERIRLLLRDGRRCALGHPGGAVLNSAGPELTLPNESGMIAWVLSAAP